MATLSPLLLPRLSSQHNTCHIGGAGKLKSAGDFSQRASIREHVIEDEKRPTQTAVGSGMLSASRSSVAAIARRSDSPRLTS